MKIGLGIEVDAGKRHPSNFHIPTNKIQYLKYNKLDNKIYFIIGTTPTRFGTNVPLSGGLLKRRVVSPTRT
jgi:hypothetical protein